MDQVKYSSVTEWRANWTVVLAAAIGFSFMSILTPATGVFMVPLADAFGWTRTEFTAGVAVAAIISVFASPFVGFMVDRLGVRRTAIPGIVLTIIAVMTFAAANGSIVQWLILWAFWGTASLFIQSNVWTAAVASVFVQGRGLALGLTLAGTAVAQVFIPPIANFLIANFGWREAFLYLGAGWGGLALIFCLFFLYDVRDQNRLAARKKSDDSPTDLNLPGLTIPEAWRNPDIWKIAISTVLILMITVAISVHQYPILIEAGLRPDNAAWMLSLFGIAAFAGKLVTGALMDKFHGRWVGSITFILVGFAYMLMLEPFRSPATIVVAMIVGGYAGGTKMQLCGYLTARYAGLRNYAAIFGAMTSAIALASGLGPLLGGVVYDYTGSYNYLLMAGMVLPVVSGLLLINLSEYPTWEIKCQ